MNKIKVCLIYCLFLISRVSAQVYCISDSDLYINNPNNSNRSYQQYNNTKNTDDFFDPGQITKDPNYIYIVGSFKPNNKPYLATLFYRDSNGPNPFFTQINLAEKESRADAVASLPISSTKAEPATTTPNPTVYVAGSTGDEYSYLPRVWSCEIKTKTIQLMNLP